jgi:hypothetical protein
MISSNGSPVLRGLLGLPFFYPWAAGLVLINVGRSRRNGRGV